MSRTVLTASPLFHFHNNLVRRNCYPISLIRKQAKEKLSRALVPTNRLPGSSGGAHATGRLRGNRVRPAPSPPPNFRSCAPGLWRAAPSGRHGHFPLAPSNTNAQAGTSCSRGPLRAAFLGLSSILYRFLHPSYRVSLRDD